MCGTWTPELGPPPEMHDTLDLDPPVIRGNTYSIEFPANSFPETYNDITYLGIKRTGSGTEEYAPDKFCLKYNRATGELQWSPPIPHITRVRTIWYTSMPIY
ncbi:MAG: hypothetical protein ACM3PP_06400, partial [Candidatus Saccharibacteria bacterium]